MLWQRSMSILQWLILKIGKKGDNAGHVSNDTK